MVSGNELASRVESFRNRTVSLLERNILDKAGELKPNVVSFAERMTRFVSLASSILAAAGKKIGEEGHGAVITPRPAWSAYIYRDKIAVTRLKPRYSFISYDSSADELTIRIRNSVIRFTGGRIVLAKEKVVVEIDPRNPDEIAGNIYEIKYVTRGAGKRLAELASQAQLVFA